MIADHFTTSFTVTRSVWTTDEDDNPHSAEQAVTTFMGHIQQARAELLANLGLTLTKAFTLWCPVDTDVKPGDSLTGPTATYSVRAANRRDYGDNEHLELIVEEDEVDDES